MRHAIGLKALLFFSTVAVSVVYAIRHHDPPPKRDTVQYQPTLFCDTSQTLLVEETQNTSRTYNVAHTNNSNLIKRSFTRRLYKGWHPPIRADTIMVSKNIKTTSRKAWFFISLFFLISICRLFGLRLSHGRPQFF